MKEVADLEGIPKGAYNIRKNGQLLGREVSANINIETNQKGDGIIIDIKPKTIDESVHIPVILSQAGLHDVVYNTFVKGVVDKESGSILRSLLIMCKSIGKDMDERALERDILDVLNTYYAVPIKDMNTGRLLMALSGLLRTHRLRLPSNLVFMIKALMTAEGSARLIYPDLDVVSETRDLVHRLALKRYKPEIVWRRISNVFSSIWSLQQELPDRIRHIISKLDNGKLEMRFQLDELEQLVTSLENASNRLTTGIITGSIIMGSSMIITTGIGPYIFGLPVLGVIGYIMSVLLGMWLIITILRTKK